MADSNYDFSEGSGSTAKSVTTSGGEHAPTTVTAYVDATPEPVEVSSSNPLPVTQTGVATEAKQDTGNTSLAALAGTVSGSEIQVDIVSGGGTGTEYTSDDAAPATAMGIANVMERDDALSSVTPIEGDWIKMRGTAEGALWTQDANSDALLTDTNTIASDTTSIDGKITACDTGSIAGTVTANLGTIAGVATEVTAAAILADTASLDGKVTACDTGSIAGTVTANLGTIAGAATEVTAAAILADTASLDGKVTACNTGAVTISAALPAGTNNIGDVDIASALPAGTNNIGDVDVATLPGTTEADIGTIAGDTTSIDGKITACNTGAVTISAALPAGTNNIGDVDIASALPAGTNNIGDVDVVTLPKDGQAVKASSIPVTMASDQEAMASDTELHSTTVSVSAGTLTAGLYATGDVIGGKMTFSSILRSAQGSGVIQTVVVQDLTDQGVDMYLIIFNADPSSSTFTNDAAIDVDDADLSKIAGIIPITSHYVFADNTISQALNIGLAVDAGATTLYAVLVDQGGRTQDGTTDIDVSITVLQD